jgi:hypothetical protein
VPKRNRSEPLGGPDVVEQGVGAGTEGGASLERTDSRPVSGKSSEDPGTVVEPVGVGSRLVEAGKAVRTLNAAAWKKLDLTPYLLGTALEGV